MRNFQRLALPGIGHLANTYATMAVWSGSTSQPVKWLKWQKKAAIKLWHRAREFDRQTHQPGKHGGAIGTHGLAVLHALIFDFMNFKTGQLDPSYEGIAKKAGIGRTTVWRAINRLRVLGILNWVRRCQGIMRGDRFVLEQERNAYVIHPETQWRGYRPPPQLPTAPDAGTWGEHPSMPSAVHQAALDQQEGMSLASRLDTLKSDPGDALAQALARLGKCLNDRDSSLN
jgi:hypothetical protein